MKRYPVTALIALLFFCGKLLAQSSPQVDSIKRLLNEKPDYPDRIKIIDTFLQKNYLSNFDETILLARWGAEWAGARKDSVNQGNFLRIIGLTLAKKGEIDSASSYYYRALDLLQNKDDYQKLGLLYDDMARLYRKLRQTDRALDFYEKALQLYEANNDLEGIARINNESGVVYRDEGNYSEANRRFEKSWQIQRERNDSVGMGYALEFLGYNQLLVKDYKKSESYLLQALDIRKGVGEDFALMLNYTALGELYQETRQYPLSNEYFQQSNKIARKINFSDIQKYNYEKLTSNFEAMGNYQQALETLKLFNVINDSLYTAQRLKDVEEISARYETAEKENKILQQQVKLARRNGWIFGLGALTAIVALIGYYFYKQQALKTLRQQKENELLLVRHQIESQQQLQQQRLSISRDLHDSIGAQLSFIISAIETAEYYAKDQNGHLVTRLQQIGSFAKEALQELRDSIWATNKQDISIADLQSRVVNLMEKARQSYPHTQFNFDISERVAEDRHFTGSQGLHIFRIVQEAIHNALKHAEATQIDLQIDQEDQCIVIVVKDNGRGFSESTLEPGNGLLNMRKRAAELGSSLNLYSDIGRGTVIRFCVAI